MVQDIMPFFGEGKILSSDIVRDRVRKLPGYLTEMRDQCVNTIVLLSFQFGAYSLVNILWKRVVT